MNFGLPSLRPDMKGSTDLNLKPGEYGVHDSFSFGFRNVASNLEPCHPLEVSEKNFEANQEKLHMSILRNTQGLHAPMRLAAEMRATRNVGRLPFLESSNLALATLKCSDDTIDFTDVLGLPDMEERMFIPHVVMEHKLGIL